MFDEFYNELKFDSAIFLVPTIIFTPFTGEE